MLNRELYHLKKEIKMDDFGLDIKVYEPVVNLENKYIVEYKVPKVDVLDEDIQWTVSALIQIDRESFPDYKLLNVYYKGHNWKAESMTKKYRLLLDKVVPQLDLK